MDVLWLQSAVRCKKSMNANPVSLTHIGELAMRRHQDNSNLILHYDQCWHGLPVQTQHGPLIDNYLQRMHAIVCQTLNEYPRLSAFRFDLRFPCYRPESDSAVITRFTESLKARIEASEARRRRSGRRVHSSRVRFIWVKERDSSIHWHYHVVLLLNKDAYYSFGRFEEYPEDAWLDVPKDPHAERSDCLADLIVGAWASALGARPEQVAGVLNFSENGTYHVNVGSPDYVQQFEALFRRISYLAKAETKQYGDASNTFGCSRG